MASILHCTLLRSLAQLEMAFLSAPLPQNPPCCCISDPHHFQLHIEQHCYCDRSPAQALKVLTWQHGVRQHTGSVQHRVQVTAAPHL